MANNIGSNNTFTGRGSFFYVYPEKIRLLGLSTSGHVGDANVAGEISLRNNVPLEMASSVVALPGQFVDGRDNILHATGRALTFQASTIWQVPRNSVWETASLVAEVGGNTLLATTKNAAAASPLKGRNNLLASVAFEPGWYQPIADVDLFVPLTLAYTFTKRDTVLMGMGDPRGGSASIGLKFNYANSVKGGLSYQHYLGAERDGYAWADRNFLVFNVNYSF